MPASAAANIRNRFMFSPCLQSLLPWFEPKAQVDVDAPRPGAVIRLDWGRERICGGIGADTGFQILEQRDIPGVAGGIASDAERAPGRAVELRFQIRRVGEQLVLVHQLESPGEEVSPADRVD